jgi:hypothetical protein
MVYGVCRSRPEVASRSLSPLRPSCVQISDAAKRLTRHHGRLSRASRLLLEKPCRVIFSKLWPWSWLLSSNWYVEVVHHGIVPKDLLMGKGNAIAITCSLLLLGAGAPSPSARVLLVRAHLLVAYCLLQLIAHMGPG